MLLLGSVLLAALLPCSWGRMHIKPPVAKCKNPMPGISDIDFSKVAGTEYKYIYTPDVKLFSVINNVKMTFSKTEKPKFYKETLVGKTKVGLKKSQELETEDIGDGVMKITKMDDEVVEYFMSVVATVGDLNLFYLCSDTAGKDGERDSLYVISKTDAEVKETEPPSVIFKEALEKYNFNAKFHKLSKHKKSSKKDKKDESSTSD